MSKKFKIDRFGSKQLQKHIAGKCYICGEKDYSILDAHRIVEGGSYSVHNVVILCCKCHRLQQAGKIKILEWCNSTAGKLLHWIDEQGQEHFT